MHERIRPEKMTTPTSIAQVLHDPSQSRVAYFSMEIALDPEIPTYAGGLGVLAGDMLRAAADMKVPMVGVTLVHRNGYFSPEAGRSGQSVGGTGAVAS